MNRKLLASAICASLLVAGTSYAQNNPAPQQSQNPPTNRPQTLNTITVTGTHIRQAEIETAQPVVTITRSQIEHEGYTNVADVLQNLTVAGTPPISREQVLLSGEDVGGYYVDLRNLGASRTLVLLNGKRLGTSTSGLSDLQQVPMAAIDRIEVLKDGASAIYGSDAIAGVVNIITRNRFNGAEANFYLGQYDQGDGNQKTGSFTLGANGDKGSVMVVAEYSKQDPVWASSRWFSSSQSTNRHPTAGWTPVSQWGAFDLTDIPGGPACGDTSPYGLCTLSPGGNYLNLNDWHGTNAAGGTNDLTNSNLEMMLQTATERKSVFLSGTYDFTDHLHFQSDILYTHRDTTQQVAGYPLQLLGFSQGDPYANPLSAYSYYNPLGYWHNPSFDAANADDYDIYGYRRGWEVPRVTQMAMTTFRFGATLSGDFNIGDRNWQWNAGGFINRNRSLQTGHGNNSLPATNAALGPSFLNSSGQVQCGTPDNPLPYGTAPGSCIPWNPLIPAGTVGPGSLTDNPGLQTLLFPYYHDTGLTRTFDYSADISGPIVTLPGGDLAVALGVEYRRDDGNFVPDAFRQSGLSTDLGSGPTQGSYTVKSEYIEVAVPLLKDLPLAHALEFDAALRHSKYSTFGSTNNPKYSLTWRPIEDLLVRGTFAKGFRAPQISDLFGGIGGTFAYYTDPCGVNQQAGSNPAVAQRCTSGFGGQVPVPPNFHQTGQGGVVCTSFPCQTGTQFFAGSNPLLQPETAMTRTAGIVYSPSFVPGRLDLSVDWYNIRINNVISGDSMASILNDCYVLGIASRCSTSLFRRDPTTGVIDYALIGEKNAGWEQAKGWDFGVHYRLPQTSFGVFALTWNTTYVSQLNDKADNQPDTPINPDNSWGGNFRIRSNASLDWDMGPWGATWTTHYYSSMKEKCSWNNTSAGGPECNMPGYVENNVVMNVNRQGASTFHDFQIRYRAPWKGTISFGVNNVFDHWSGPMYSDPNSQYAYYGGFPIGRFYYVQYNQRF